MGQLRDFFRSDFWRPIFWLLKYDLKKPWVCFCIRGMSESLLGQIWHPVVGIIKEKGKPIPVYLPISFIETSDSQFSANLKFCKTIELLSFMIHDLDKGDNSELIDQRKCLWNIADILATRLNIYLIISNLLVKR